MVHQKVLQFYAKLSGHQTLEKQDEPPVKKTSKAVILEDDDDFGDDPFSAEEVLEFEKMAATARF